MSSKTDSFDPWYAGTWARARREAILQARKLTFREKMEWNEQKWRWPFVRASGGASGQAVEAKAWKSGADSGVRSSASPTADRATDSGVMEKPG